MGRFAVERRVPRFAVERRADADELFRRAVVLRPPRDVLARFAVVLRRVVERFAVVFRPAPRAGVLFFRPDDERPPLERRVVLRPPPPEDEPLIGDGAGGVGLAGCGVGQTEPGSFCADQSVPWSSVMVPPPADSAERCATRDSENAPSSLALQPIDGIVV